MKVTAQAATLLVSDGFESYPLGGQLASPWINVSNTRAFNAQAHSGTQSALLGYQGTASSATLPLGSTPNKWILDVWLWINPVGGTAQGQYIGCRPSGSTTGIMLGIDQTGAGQVFAPGASPVTFFSFTGVTLSTWHHCILTVSQATSGGTITLTIDGTSTGTFTGNTADTGGALSVGALVMVGQGIGPSPTAEIYVDDLQVFSNLGPSTALDFPNPPLTTNQIYNAPNGVTYTWDGAVWAASGTGSGTTPVGPAGGDLTGTYPNPTIKPTSLPWTPSAGTLTPTDPTKSVTVLGSSTGPTSGSVILGNTQIKGRVQEHNGAPQVALTINRDWPAGNIQDDASKPSWGLALRADQDVFLVQRAAPGVPGTQTSLLAMDNGGGTTVTGALVSNAAVWAGPSTTGRAMLNPGSASNCGYLGWYNNAGTRMGYLGFAPVGGGRHILAVNEGGATGINISGNVNCTLDPGIVQKGMLAVQATIRTASSVACPANFSNGTNGAWITVASFSIAASGGWIFLLFQLAGNFNVSATAGLVYHGVLRNGSPLAWSRFDMLGTNGGKFPIPAFHYWDAPAAGTYTYAYGIYQSNVSFANVQIPGDAQGAIAGFEMS